MKDFQGFLDTPIYLLAYLRIEVCGNDFLDFREIAGCGCLPTFFGFSKFSKKLDFSKMLCSLNTTFKEKLRLPIYKIDSPLSFELIAVRRGAFFGGAEKWSANFFLAEFESLIEHRCTTKGFWLMPQLPIRSPAP